MSLADSINEVLWVETLPFWNGSTGVFGRIQNCEYNFYDEENVLWEFQKEHLWIKIFFSRSSYGYGHPINIHSNFLRKEQIEGFREYFWRSVIDAKFTRSRGFFSDFSALISVASWLDFNKHQKAFHETQGLEAWEDVKLKEIHLMGSLPALTPEIKEKLKDITSSFFTYPKSSEPFFINDKKVLNNLDTIIKEYAGTRFVFQVGKENKEFKMSELFHHPFHLFIGELFILYLQRHVFQRYPFVENLTWYGEGVESDVDENIKKDLFIFCKNYKIKLILNDQGKAIELSSLKKEKLDLKLMEIKVSSQTPHKKIYEGLIELDFPQQDFLDLGNKQFFHLKKNKLVTFHESFAEFQKKNPELIENDKKIKQQQDLVKYTYHIKESNLHYFQMTFNDLKELGTIHNQLPVITSDLVLNVEDEVVTFSYKGQSIPRYISNLAISLREGLAFEYDIDHYVTKDRKFRSLELRLFRHGGFFLTLLARWLEASQEKKYDLLTGPVSDFILEIFAKNPQGKIEDYISAKMIKFLKNWSPISSPHSRSSWFDELVLVDESYLRTDKEILIRQMSEFLVKLASGCLSKKELTKKQLSFFNPFYRSEDYLKGDFEGFFHTDFSQLSFIFPQAIGHIFNLGMGEILIKGKEPTTLENFSASMEVISEHKKNNKQGPDWFALHPAIFFDGIQVKDFSQLNIYSNRVLEYEGKIYLLKNENVPTFEWLQFFWKKISAQKKERFFKWEESFVNLAPHQLLEFLMMESMGIAIIAPGWEEIKKQRENILSGQTSQNLNQLAKNLTIDLKDYQKFGLQWLYERYLLKLGGILADDMGLGKTVQMIALFDVLRQQEQLGHSLIVVPTSLTYNWESELKRFAPKIPCIGFQSHDQNELEHFLQIHPQALVIVTYGLVARHQMYLERITSWNILTLDEAGHIKNILSKRASGLREFQARVKFSLTGTPLENHLGEFFSLVDLSVPHLLGSYEEFRKNYVTKDFLQQNASDLKKEMEYLREKTKPLILRRTKSQVLTELPDKSESTVLINFESEQKKIYRDIAVSFNEKITQLIDNNSSTMGNQVTNGEGQVQLQMLSALLRLRQVCSYPGAIPKVEYSKTPPKLEYLFEQIDLIIENGEKALIFTNFLSTLNFIESVLRERKILVETLYGGKPNKARQQALKNFKEHSGGAVMLMTMKTGGVGLNLTEASYVFHIEPWWNPATENQATDRAHRLGQKNHVQVYRYLMRESVEERMLSLKKQKSQLASLLLEEDFEMASNDASLENMAVQKSLSLSDFKMLIS